MSIKLHGKPIKRSNDHWWPRSLSQYWCNKEGWCHQINFRGELKESKGRKGFGKISNGHLIEKEGVWARTAEPLFNKADKDFPSLIRLLEIKINEAKSGLIFWKKISTKKFTFSNEELDILSECLASLIARSPSFRNTIKITTNSYRVDNFGLEPINELDPLIVMNLVNSFKDIKNSIKNSGLKFLLYSKKKEFVFGDGFYHTASSSVSGVNTRLKTVIPLTPNVAFACSYATQYSPGFRVVELTTDQVDEINITTQAYSKNFLFYRNQKPKLIPEFTKNEHLVYSFGEFSLLDKISAPFIFDQNLIGFAISQKHPIEQANE